MQFGKALSMFLSAAFDDLGAHQLQDFKVFQSFQMRRSYYREAA